MDLRNFDRPILCLVTNREVAGATLVQRVADAVTNGVDWLQIREKDLEANELLELADDLVSIARGNPRPVRVLLNRRADVALSAGADGMHLGFDAVTLREARALLGPDAWLGVSAHDRTELAAAAQAGASYAQLAPIHPPLSKPASRPPLGETSLGWAAEFGLPVLAQGGIDAGNAAAACRAGAAGVAVTGAILAAADSGRAAAALRANLDQSAAGTPPPQL